MRLYLLSGINVGLLSDEGRWERAEAALCCGGSLWRDPAKAMAAADREMRETLREMEVPFAGLRWEVHGEGAFEAYCEELDARWMVRPLEVRD